MPNAIRAKPGPRWSVVTPGGTSALLPALKAALLVVMAMVRVGPPLPARPPRLGLCP